MAAIRLDIVDEARRVVAGAESADVTLRVLGGVAVQLHTDGEVHAELARPCRDIDLVTTKKQGRASAAVLRDLGYEPNTRFNAMHGSTRLVFYDREHGRQVDVFVGEFRMCHAIPIADRLHLERETVPLAELLLTKLQIVQLNEKDVRDALLLVHGHEVGDGDGDMINGARIAALCAGDWGLWRTITANVETVLGHAGGYDVPDTDRERIAARLREVLVRVEEEPKTRGWRLRAKIGERKRWYELPEEVE
jgi:hypothetical protein